MKAPKGATHIFAGIFIKIEEVPNVGSMVYEWNHAFEDWEPTSYDEEWIGESLENGPLLELDIKPDNNMVKKPSHYQIFPGVEAIQVIASTMTKEQFYGYCLGSLLKYKLRCGHKDDPLQELGKAEEFKNLYDKHNHLCK